MITKVKTHNHDEWLSLRKQYIGGSDAAAVIGLNPYRSAYSLWAEKTGRIEGFGGNLATQVGAYLEELVAKLFEERTGKRVRRANQSFINDEYPWAIANIDRELIGEDAGLEIKTTDSLNLKKFKDGEYPSVYYVQCVHYMAVTGKKRWYLAVLIGNKDFRIFTIERDEAEIAALMNAERTFWNNVINDTPPPPDGSQATSDALASIYDKSTDETVDLMSYGSDLDCYCMLGKRIGELKAERDEVANKIKQYMTDAGTGYAERYKVSWKAQDKPSFDHKRFAKEHPDIDLSSYYKTTTSRVFRVSEI